MMTSTAVGDMSVNDKTEFSKVSCARPEPQDSTIKYLFKVSQNKTGMNIGSLKKQITKTNRAGHEMKKITDNQSGIDNIKALMADLSVYLRIK